MQRKHFFLSNLSAPGRSHVRSLCTTQKQKERLSGDVTFTAAVRARRVYDVTDWVEKAAFMTEISPLSNLDFVLNKLYCGHDQKKKDKKQHIFY